MKILLFSSVCKPEIIYTPAIHSYLQLQSKGFEIDYCFKNDNNSGISEFEGFIEKLKIQYTNRKIFSLETLNNEKKSSYGNHNWDSEKINRVIDIKNNAIDFAIQHDYDYLFLVDADLVLHPNTINHLVSLKKDFVFEVFWTQFFSEPYHKPNAWDVHSWNYLGPETLLKLSKSGTYIVGGGGACTLLSKKILTEGLNFSRLASLSYQGEDRHFCTRAQALGYDIWVDTYYPCYHIFSEKQVDDATAWFSNGALPEFFSKWLDLRWEEKVKKSFINNPSFIFKLRRFHYEIRRSYKKIFANG